jgi:hypothetical protein
VRQEHGAGLGQVDGAGLPHEQVTAKVALEQVDLLRQRGWDMLSRSAARVKCNSSATATKYRRPRKCTSIANGYLKRSWTVNAGGEDHQPGETNTFRFRPCST